MRWAHQHLTLRLMKAGQAEEGRAMRKSTWPLLTNAKWLPRNFMFGSNPLDCNAVSKELKNCFVPFPAIYWEYQKCRIQLTTAI